MVAEYNLLSAGGHNALWVTFICMAIAAVVFTALSAKELRYRREHFYATTVVVFTAALSYYAMATGKGRTRVEYDGVVRDIWWARYVDWSITTPLLLIDLFLMAKLPLPTAGWIIAADLGMVVTGLFGALTNDVSRWGWYAFGCIFMVAIFYTLLTEGKELLEQRDSALTGFYTTLTWSLVALWTAYPIVWALAEGTNYISANVEVYAYAVLDIAAKIGFGSVILHNNAMLMASYGKGIGDVETPLLQE